MQTLQDILLLQLLLGVVLELVAFGFIGVDVLATEIFSVSVSESCSFEWTVGFLFKGAISFNISTKARQSD